MDQRYSCMVECVSSLLLDLPISPLLCDSHIFGTAPEDDDQENRPPSMADMIRAKRAAQKAADKPGPSQQAGGDRSLRRPLIFVGILY